MCIAFENSQKKARAEGFALGRNEGIVLGRNEGIALGRNEGIALGRNEGAKKAAIHMSELGVDIELIAKYLQVTLEKVQQWLLDSSEQ